MVALHMTLAGAAVEPGIRISRGYPKRASRDGSEYASSARWLVSSVRRS
jgi:hypothetical protein